MRRIAWALGVVGWVAACGSTSNDGGNSAARGGSSGAGGLAGRPNASGAGGSVAGAGAAATAGVTATAGASGSSGSSGSSGASAGRGGSGGGAAQAGSSESAGEAGSAGNAGEGGAISDCTPETPCDSLVPTDCSIAPVSVVPATLCAGAPNCPVSAAYALRCDGWGYGPWIAATPNNDAVVGMFTAIGVFRARVFSIATQEVRELTGLGDHEATFTVDANGHTNAFSERDHSLARARQTATGYQLSTGDAAPDEDYQAPLEARALDDENAFVAYFKASSRHPQLATIKDGCWSAREVAALDASSLALDLDAQNRPWLAWFADNGGIGVAGPNGKAYSPSTSLGTVGDQYVHPALLAGGLTGNSAFPAVAAQAADGLHVVTPDSGTATWTDRVVPNSKARTLTTNCPTPSTEIPDVCGGLTTCTEHYAGAPQGLALARTTSGKAYVAWLDETSQATYDLTAETNCGACFCERKQTSASGSVDIVIARVQNATTPPSALRRFHFQTGGPVQMNRQVLAMTAHGETLHVVASISDDTNAFADLRYLKIEASGLPE